MRSARLDAAGREALAARVSVTVRPGGYDGLDIAGQLLLHAAAEAGREAVLRELRRPAHPVLAGYFTTEGCAG